MKRLSKIVSLALSVTMAASCFTGLSICSASAADDETKIYFEVPALESWGTTKSVYCHVYNVYGGTPLTETSWQSKAERCKKDSETGLYYFDTSKLGTIEEGADYALLFSTVDTDKVAHQTGNITFGQECLGDTVYVTGEMVENTEDSSKMDFEGAWKNNSDKYGAKAAITSTGKIVGKYFPVYQPKEQIISQFLCSWAVLNESILTPEIVQADCEQIGVAPAAVLEQYKTDYADMLADPENYPTVASVEKVAALLGVDPYPTETETKIYFEVPALESWGTTKRVYCHVYNVYGGTPLTETAWQSKAERCSLDDETGLYYFDTSKLGTIEEGADYALLFSAVDTENTHYQTGNITFGKECLGDTVYVTSNMIENSEDSMKMDFEAAWKNNSDKYGAKAAITSTGKIVGKYFPVYQPKEQIVSQFLCSWAVLHESILTPEIVQADCEQIGVEPAAVLEQYKTDYADMLADPENYPTVASVEAVAALLGISEFVLGDVDNDGKISIEDSTLILKSYVNLVFLTSTQIKAADVNNDGVVNVKDATLIQKYLVELITEF